MSAMRVVRGVLVDVVLAAAAAALSWHPVSGFFHRHPAVVYWGVGLAHIAVAPLLVMHAFTGGSQARDLVRARQGRTHGFVFRASNVAILTLGFFLRPLRDSIASLGVAESSRFPGRRTRRSACSIA